MTKSDSAGTFEWTMQKEIRKGFTTDVEIVLFITAEEMESDSKYTCRKVQVGVTTETRTIETPIYQIICTGKEEPVATE